MTLNLRSFPVVPQAGNDLRDEVVLVPSGGAGEGDGNEQRTSLGDVVPGTTSGNDLDSRFTEQTTIKPIVKWAGGKTRLLPELLKRVPASYARYYEPFAGGAALFFALQPERAVVSDANADLMAMYRAIAEDVDTAILWLREHEIKHNQEHYYLVREWWNERLMTSTAKRAAAFLYLNKTCFNGLWRVNSKGEFNVPIGDYSKPKILDADALRAASQVLARAELLSEDYRGALHDAGAGDFVYLDPPYDETFNGYTTEGTFDQATLARIVHILAKRGCHVLVSNSDTPLIRELYADFDIEVVRNQRSVNSNGDDRGGIDELLITATPRKPMTFMPTEQPYLPVAGVQPPDENPDVRDAITRELDLADELRALRTRFKAAQDATTAKMVELGLERHPYIDGRTGKRRFRLADTTPKAKTIAAAGSPGRRKRKRGGPERDDAVINPDGTSWSDDRVESRRVKRSKSHDVMADPFGSTRANMKGGVLEQAEAVQKGKPFNPPKLATRGKGKRGK